MKRIKDFLLAPLPYLFVGLINFFGGFCVLIALIMNRTFSFDSLFCGFALLTGFVIIGDFVIDYFIKRKSSGSPDDK